MTNLTSDEYKKNLLLNLMQEHVTKTGELYNIEQLKALGISSKDIIHYLKILPRGCKNLSKDNTKEYLTVIKEKFPNLKVLNMSGCFLNDEIIKFLDTTNIETVFYDSTFFYNLETYARDRIVARNFTIPILSSHQLEDLSIKFIDSEWAFYYFGYSRSMAEIPLFKEEKDFISEKTGLSSTNMFTDDGVEKFITKCLNEGFEAQSGLDGLLNSYIFGYRTSYSYVSPPNNDFAKKIIKKLLEAGAKLRLGIVVPSLGYYNLNENSDNTLIEEISPKIEVQANILKLFYIIDPKYYEESILPYIYKYLPEDWKSLKSEWWQDNEEEDEPLIQMIYQEFKYFLDKPMLVQNNSGIWEQKFLLI